MPGQTEGWPADSPAAAQHYPESGYGHKGEPLDGWGADDPLQPLPPAGGTQRDWPRPGAGEEAPDRWPAPPPEGEEDQW
jgi:hypothetical protein